MHGSIYGKSGSGKTYAASKLIVAEARRLGMPVAVMDPMSFEGKSEDFSADFITSNKEEAIDFFYSNIGFLFIWEEAGVYLTHKDQQMFTRGRHFGHINIVSSQRATQVDKTIRDQCTSFGLVFKQGYDDSRALGKEFAYIDINNASGQKARECYVITNNYEKQAKTDTPEGEKLIKDLAKNIVKSAPLPTLNLIKKAGIGGRMNKDFLYKERFLYEGYEC
jgi:hypothetical protein